MSPGDFGHAVAIGLVGLLPENGAHNTALDTGERRPWLTHF
jgi:hypothetical protein